MKLSELIIGCASFLRLRRAKRRVVNAARQGITIPGFGPTSINLMMIDICNSGCIMCGHDYKHCGSREALTLDKMKAIYGHLNVNQLTEVIYGGGGEPFLNQELGSIAAYTRKRIPWVQHTVISNFISADTEVLEKLVESRVHFLISINAATRDTYRAIAGIDAFSRVCDNIRKLVKIREKQKSTIGISVSIILMKQNIKELDKLIRLAYELGIDSVKSVYVRIYPEFYRRKHDGNTLISPNDSLFYQQEESNKALQAADVLAGKLGISFEHPPFFGNSCSKTRDCVEPWKSLFINFNGALFPCAAGEIVFMNKVNSGYYNSGNILNQTIDEIWSNRFWRCLRKTNAVRDREEIISECQHCAMSIDWLGPDHKEAHIMDWDTAEKSDLRL